MGYVKDNYIFRGRRDAPRAALFPPEYWCVFDLLINGLPITNNFAESANSRWNARYPGQQKPSRSKVVEGMRDVEEEVRYDLER